MIERFLEASQSSMELVRAESLITDLIYDGNILFLRKIKK
jgi:hypothetical protein